MKFYLMFTAIFISFYGCSDKHKDNFFIIKTLGNEYAIDFKDSSISRSDDMYYFYKRVKTINLDEKLIMIKELLKFKGDKRKAKIILVNYNKNSSQYYTGNDDTLTLEVQALFLINQIYFNNPFYYAPYAIPVEAESNKSIITNTDKMNLFFTSYEEWFSLVSEQGIEKSKILNIKPLDYSKYKWIYGIDVDASQALQFDLTNTSIK